MKKRKNTGAKIVAFIALLAIVLSIVGTGILFITSSFTSQKQLNDQDDISIEDIQKLIESQTGASLEVTPEENIPGETLTGSTS